MPNLKTIRNGNAKLTEGPPLVIAIVAATSGIGSYIARAWATTFANHGSKLRVYIIGRNATRAEELLDVGRKTSSGSEWQFIQVSDLSLLEEVDKVSREIIDREEANPFYGGPPRLDALYMSQANSPLASSPKTQEGIDMQMSLLYYSRMRFIQNLIPLLRAAPASAHVISVFAGSFEDTIKAGHEPVGTPASADYGVTAVRLHTTFMKTFLFEELAEQNAGKISFTHIYPGLVDGPAFYSDVNPLWFRIVWRMLNPLLSLLYMTSPQDCGAVMVFLTTQRYPAKGAMQAEEESKIVGGVARSSQDELGGGSYGVGQRGDEQRGMAWTKYRKDDLAKRVWDHTMETFAMRK